MTATSTKPAIAPTPNHAVDEAEIRRMIAAWSRALEAKDVDGLTADYAPDAVLFDVKPNYRVDGPEAIRQVWRQCLPHFPATFRSEHRDLQLTVGGDVAFCTALHHLKIPGEPHPAGSTWMRVTVCYRKIDGKWRVAHEHVSLPFNPMTGQVAYITDADLK